MKAYIIEQFARFLLGGMTFTRIQGVVERLADSSLSGEDKRQMAYKTIADIGIELSTWLINLGIELAVSALKTKVK